MMEMRKNRFINELTRKLQVGKSSPQDIVKRMLIGFFILMLLLTLISRAADSFTVARVFTEKVKGGLLSFEITGNGTIEAAAEKYLDLYEGVRVEAIAVKEGQSVEQGELLFTYDLQELKQVRESLLDEYTIAALSVEKGELSNQAIRSASEAESAGIAVKRAELDLEIARLELEAEKRDDIKEKYNRLEAAREAVRDAEDSVEETLEGRHRAVEEASNKVSKAEQALQELFADRTKAETVIKDYKTAAVNSSVNLSEQLQRDLKDTAQESKGAGVAGETVFGALEEINTSFQTMLNYVFSRPAQQVAAKDMDPLLMAELAFFMQYYGEKAYESHAQEVHRAQVALERAKEDYLLTFISGVESGGALTTSQKAACIRAYQDAYDTLQRLTEKDRELSIAILTYGAAVQSKNDPDSTEAYHHLLSLLYQEDEEKQRAIKAAKEQITDGQKELEQTIANWDRKLAKVKRTLGKAEHDQTEVQEICDRIENGTYDYGEDLRIVNSQVRSAERSLEDAKAALEKAKKNDEITLSENKVKEQINRIDKEINQLELEKKKKAMEEIDKIIEQNGEVVSPVAGTLLHSELVVGSKLSGAEKLSISMDHYYFHAKVGKEDAKHLTAGEEISIALENGRNRIVSAIESVGPADSQGLSELSAILPEGEYRIGAVAVFSVTVKSKQYPQTIPLQAVRMDANQVYYVLVIEERNTSLGHEKIAYRRNVNVLEKDYQTAAIDAVIDPKENIIVSSSKSIEEGDRVRLNDKGK